MSTATKKTADHLKKMLEHIATANTLRASSNPDEVGEHRYELDRAFDHYEEAVMVITKTPDRPRNFFDDVSGSVELAINAMHCNPGGLGAATLHALDTVQPIKNLIDNLEKEN